MDPSPAKAVWNFFASDWIYAGGVALASFVYLLVDLFIVIRSFASILRARSFWVFWFCVSILNLLAFEALNSVPDIAKRFGAAAGLALVVMSTLGTITILQSFALKVGGQKVVDVSKFMDDFRATVLQDISRQQAIAVQKDTRETAARLFAALRDRPAELHQAFVSVMAFGGRDTDEVRRELDQIGKDAATLDVPEALVLARKVAQTDLREATNLARRAEWDKSVLGARPRIVDSSAKPAA